MLPSVIIAQTTNTCPDIVNLALQAADELCADLGRNMVCYGNFRLDATPQERVSSFYFDRIGDIAPVNDLASLRISPMNEETGEWGVAVMALQANLPDTLPGQNVTFILFGDVMLENATTPEQVENGEFTPMQAFYLKTGIGDAGCSEAPDSGLLVQTPKGVGEIAFNVNGVDVTMGSTVFFQATNTDQLTATTIEGSAVLTVDEQSFPVLAGTRFGIERVDTIIQTLSDFPQSYADILDRLTVLPLRLLDREIQIQPPLDDEALDQLRQRLVNHLPLCGEAPFPPCDEVPTIIGGEPCVFPENYEDNRVPLDIAHRPICAVSQFFGNIPPIGNMLPNMPATPPDNRTCIYPPRPGDPPLPPSETRPFCTDLGTMIPPDNPIGNVMPLPALNVPPLSNFPTPTPTDDND
ncbi:MAG: hypothetical protein CUN52_12115 [Phototrophicales bacterium]|nr:MAG: hypothetical protein CUN52_12115 [Phototrophicales bacterium]